MYDINLEDWAMNYINNIAITYSKVSKGITLWLSYLQDKKLEKI